MAHAGDREAAELYDSAATTCRSVGDWSALADMAEEAYRKLNSRTAPANEVPA